MAADILIVSCQLSFYILSTSFYFCFLFLHYAMLLSFRPLPFLSSANLLHRPVFANTQRGDTFLGCFQEQAEYLCFLFEILCDSYAKKDV